ncbi:MAG: hypothetical protein GW913_13990 [Myxococcales bacterium]|nr:hypothetical protein [Myxococcales bacterium]
MNPSRRHRLLLGWSPAALFMATIWVLSSMPLAVPLVARFPFRDRGVHFCVYTLLALMVMRAARITWPHRSAVRVVLFGILVTVLWGLSDELHQAFVPGRSSELLDLLADTLGAVTAALMMVVYWARRGAPAHEASLPSVRPSAPPVISEGPSP